MRPTWKWSIIFYGLGLLIAVSLIFLSATTNTEICSTQLIILIIFPFIGYFIGFRQEKKGNFRLENKHLKEIKQLLKERKSFTEVEEKIQKWKEEGYDVSELDKIIKDTK